MPNPSIAQIKAVASVAHCNSLDAKRFLISGGKILQKTQALPVKEALLKLRECGVSCNVTPEFPYSV